MILKRLENLKTFINPLSYGVANTCDELGFVLSKWGHYKEAFNIVSESFNCARKHYGEKSVEMSTEYLKYASIKFYLIKNEEDRKECLDIIDKGMQCDGLLEEVKVEYEKLAKQVKNIKL